MRSSTNALIDAFNYVRLGMADMIVSGGAEAPISIAGVGGFNAMHALSTRNDDAEHASRPFSASRDGFVMGEGAACLILEELEHALARGAKIYAEVIGGGLSADAYHLTATHPEGLGAKLVMENALADAHIKPEEVDYINVHGTSTPVGDISEAKAIKQVFGDHAYELNISSTKSRTGHLLGAAGCNRGAYLCKIESRNDIVPPTTTSPKEMRIPKSTTSSTLHSIKLKREPSMWLFPIPSVLAATMQVSSSENSRNKNPCLRYSLIE